MVTRSPSCRSKLSGILRLADTTWAADLLARHVLDCARATGPGTGRKQRLIASVPLFAGLSKKEVAQVASIADELDFKAEIALKVMQAVGDRLPADVD